MEIISIQDTRPPKFVYHGKPEFVDTTEENDWWRNENEKWVHGVDTEQGFIHGVHYWHMTQIRFKDSEGDIIRGRWRDVDDIMAADYEYDKKNFLDMNLMKRREVGGSTFFGIGVPYYETIVRKPGSNFGMTSNVQKKTTRLFKDKFLKSYGFMDERIRPVKLQDQATGLFSFRVKNHKGEELENEGSVLALQTSETREAAAAFESERITGLFVDEMFLHQYAGAVRRSAIACMKKAGIRSGICVSIGSAGNASTEGRSEALSSIKANGKPGSDIRVTFIPGYMHMDQWPMRDEHGELVKDADGRPIVINLAPNGWTDEPRSKEAIMQERRRLDLNPDKRDLLSFTVSYPMELREMFEITEGTYLPDDIESLVINRKVWLENNTVAPFVRYTPSRDAENTPTLTKDDNGFLYLQEMPIKGETYEIGCDPISGKNDLKEIGTEEALAGKRSLYACSIKRLSTQRYVGYLLLRIDDPVMLFKHTLVVQELYNDALLNLERNAGATILVEYDRHAKLHLLKKQPMYLYPDTYDKSSIIGYHKDRHNTSRIDESLWKYIRLHIDKIDFMPAIEQLLAFGKENTDIVSSMQANEISEQDRVLRDEKRARAASNRPPTQKVSVWVSRNGVMVLEEMDLPDDTSAASSEELARKAHQNLMMYKIQNGIGTDDPNQWNTR